MEPGSVLFAPALWPGLSLVQSRCPADVYFFVWVSIHSAKCYQSPLGTWQALGCATAMQETGSLLG